MELSRPAGPEAPSAGRTESVIRQEAETPLPAAVQAFVEPIRARFGDAVQGILFYGSVRRGNPDLDGLLDLIVVVDRYRRAYSGLKLPTLNALLPPNVFYLETDHDDRTLRAKFAVVSLAQLGRATKTRCLQVWFWGRLAQPTVLVWARDDDARDRLHSLLARAVRTFVSRTAPLLPAPFTADALWECGLAACYATEFRAERRTRAASLVDHDRERYRLITEAAARDLGWPEPTRAADGRALHAPAISKPARAASRAGWLVRRIQGKTLHVLRLVKATQTFEGGLDYLVWKIERHSGVKVEVSERARRHPVLAGWWTLWRLRRKGGFR